MVRMFFVVAAFAVLAFGCSGGASQCRDLCSDSMPCTGDQKLQCVASKCLLVTDAGPPSCPP